MIKKLFRHTTVKEALIYFLVWGVLYAAPLVSLLVASGHSDYRFSFHHLRPQWEILSALLIAFLVHNFFLAPLLLQTPPRKKVYLIGLFLLCAAFICFQVISTHLHRPPVLPPLGGGFGSPEERPPFGVHHLTHLALLLFTLASNMGMKIFLKSAAEHERLQRLQRENLEQELEYLKYQVNPHFLMNTLNNIHAQVDIDAARAKDSIVKLSRMMRYLLYEGTKQYIPLSVGIDFLCSYISLVRMRYTDNVDIRIDVPQNVPADEFIPPLLMVPFVENAFKHGVSYRSPSFIRLQVSLDGDNLHFSCVNSKHATVSAAQSQGGVGIPNVKKRLELIYGAGNYTLTNNETDTDYEVNLCIPISRRCPQ